MKKLVKQFWLVACMVLLVTPVLSGCFMTKYKVDFVVATGGNIEVKIGKTEVTHGSRHVHGKTLTIKVIPDGFNEIQRVRINSVEQQGTGGVYTYVLRNDVTINVQFILNKTDTPCVLCGSKNCGCDETASGKEKIDSVKALNYLAGVFADNSEIMAIIDQAVEDIMGATTLGQVVNLFDAAFNQIKSLADVPIVYPGCTCENDCRRTVCNDNFRACWPTCCFCCVCGEVECPSCSLCRCPCYDCWYGSGCCPSTTGDCEPQCSCPPKPDCKCILCDPPCDCGDCEECDD